jgi:rhamnopyranosyl-N-acetylglucosaminyl-diphospho-decaprenol beta-1,3/1,4-galactofuranosyltransferase
VDVRANLEWWPSSLITITLASGYVSNNNPEELARLLSSLEQKDDALHRLVIIDNSDERSAADSRKVFNCRSSRYNTSSYLKSEHNVGSAGGFRRGMQIAHENDFDRVWLLDQTGLFLAAA